MSLPISYSNGMNAPGRAGMLILGALMAVPAAMPSLLVAYPWLLELPMVRSAPGVTRYVVIGIGSVLIFMALVDTYDTWTIDTTGLTCERRGWLGTRTRHYDYSAIASVTINEAQESDGDGRYSLTLRLKAGRELSFRCGDSWEEAWDAKREIEDGMGVIPS